MPAAQNAALAAIRVIDRFTIFVAGLVALLLLPLIVANVIEVVMRYVLGSPTVWALDVTIMTYGSLFMLGSAYALLKGAHVRTDMFWNRFSTRTQGRIDSVAYLLLFLPVMAFVFAVSIDDFLYSYSINERSDIGLWRPIVWPFRAVVPLSALLMFVQGVSELLKSLWAARTGEHLVQVEKVEI